MKIYYFHGFGMDETNGGMFTDIANYLGNKYENEFTPFNKNIDETNQTLVAPLLKQIEIVANRLKENEQPCVVIAHSQGCVSTAYALNQTGLEVDQVILIAPPSGGSSQRFISYLETMPGANINSSSNSFAPLPNGRQAVIPQSCFSDMDRLYKDVKQIYKRIPYPLNIIRAETDETLGSANNYRDANFNITTIPSANHAFSIGNSRQELKETISSILKKLE